MRRWTRFLAGSAAALMLFAAASPALSALTARRGTVRVVAIVAVNSAIPPGSTIRGRATVRFWKNIAPTFSADATVVLNRSGNSATATVDIPYSWLFQVVRSPLTLDVSLAVSTDTSGFPSNSTGTTIPLPNDGVVTTVPLRISL
jgi:hypothetical protein